MTGTSDNQNVMAYVALRFEVLGQFLDLDLFRFVLGRVGRELGQQLLGVGLIQGQSLEGEPGRVFPAGFRLVLKSQLRNFSKTPGRQPWQLVEFGHASIVARHPGIGMHAVRR